MRSKFSQRLNRMTPAIVQEVARTMYAAGSLVATEAQISITRGAVSGKNHVASAPGSAPNQDTGVLGNNIEVLQVARLRVLITSQAPYSAALEFGTSKMAERPFMRPAAEATRERVNRMIGNAARRAIRRSMAGG
jgi:HK97 gp10 family phage protein